jgi:hypothetical protein
LNNFLDAVQDEARIEMRARQQQVPTGDPHGRDVGNAHIGARAIRVARQLGLPPAGTFAEMQGRAQLDTTLIEPDQAPRQRGGMDARGHDHHNGAAGCPVCSKHDHTDPNWRQTCPECGVPKQPAYEWSDCPSCDGGGWIETDIDGTYEPCGACNTHLRSLWLGGHMAPNHRCEVCAPSRRRRHADDD